MCGVCFPSRTEWLKYHHHIVPTCITPQSTLSSVVTDNPLIRVGCEENCCKIAMQTMVSFLIPLYLSSHIPLVASLVPHFASSPRHDISIQLISSNAMHVSSPSISHTSRLITTAIMASIDDEWNKETPITSMFEKPFLLYLKRFYDSMASEEGLSFDAFSSWKDLQDMLKAEQIDASMLKGVWADCLIHRGELTGNGLLSFDSFVRVNYRLERIIEDMSFATNTIATAKELDEYHRDIFFNVTDNEPLMSFGQFTECEPISRALSLKVLRLQQVRDMWNTLPKSPLGSFYSLDKAYLREEMGENDISRVEQSDGISVESFQSVLSDILDCFLSEEEGGMDL